MGSCSGTVIDPIQQKSFGATIEWSDESTLITAVTPIDDPPPGFILPGFVDAHIHIESTLLSPTEFARAAIEHGTLGAVIDPHEIANVLGTAGIDWMIKQTRQTPFVFGIGAPPCVPSTPFDTAGAKLDARAIRSLLERPEITHLSEVMNVPGVLSRDPDLMAKLETAKELGKPIDGHAPGLSGVSLAQYAAAGITTDHECVSLEDARNKLAAGMILQIRHGSAARLQESFLRLLSKYAPRCMFCSDDKHPNDLLKHHINYLVAQGQRNGISLYSLLLAASVNPVRHYHLPLGLLQVGDTADFQIVDRLDTFTPREVWLRGKCVLQNKKNLLPKRTPPAINRMDALPVSESDFTVHAPSAPAKMRVIDVNDGLLTTKQLILPVPAQSRIVKQDIEADLCKIIVLSRYDAHAKPVVGFVHGFGLTRGAIASSVAHDAHSIIAVGATDAALCAAVNEVILRRGALAVADDNHKVITALPLPLAGLMSADDIQTVAPQYEACDTLAKIFGSTLAAPFMTLSFLALPVIPELKITDKGLFSTEKYQHVPLFL